MFFRSECNWCKPGFFCGFHLTEEPSHFGCWATNGVCSGYGRDSRGIRCLGFYRKFDILMTSCTEKLIFKTYYIKTIQFFFNQNFLPLTSPGIWVKAHLNSSGILLRQYSHPLDRLGRNSIASGLNPFDSKFIEVKGVPGFTKSWMGDKHYFNGNSCTLTKVKHLCLLGLFKKPIFFFKNEFFHLEAFRVADLTFSL